MRGSIRDAHFRWGGGWNGGQWLEYKMVVGHNKAQKPAWNGCAGSLMAEMKQNLHFGHLDF